MEQYGDRNPAVFFNPSTSILHIASAINNDSNSVFTTAPITIKQWSSIKISQQLVDQSYIYCIYVNGSIVYSVVNKTPVKLSNVKVYASDPWYAAHSGFIRNLVIISKSLAYVSPGLLREVYYNNDKSIFTIDALKKNPKYPLTPDSYGIIDMFNAPQNIGDYYGQRIRGWFFAPQTGNYTFYSSCDDFCELYISNDSDPNNKRLIINQTSSSNYMQFNKSASQISVMVFLKENYKYYIEALMSENAVNDHLPIGVVTPYAKGGPFIVFSNFLSPIHLEMCTSAYCIRTVDEKCIPENGVYELCTCINGQKIINHQIVCHDGMETMQDSVFAEEEIPLIRDTYVATLNSLNKEYMVSFDVKPTAFYDNWASVGQWSFGNLSSISGLVNSVFYTKQLPLMQWSSINVSQALVDDSYIYSVYLNETLLSSSVNMAPVVLSNVTVYAADPWSVALIGSIRNLIITSQAEWNDWSTCNASSGIGFMNRTWLCSTQMKLELCFRSSTDFAQCDKECPELESIFLPDEMLIKKNNRVANLRKIYNEYVLSFDVKPMSYNSGWHSVIHLTNLSSNSKYGDRNPAVFFHEDSNGEIQICSAVNGVKNYHFLTSSLPLMQWSTLKISQELFNGSYVFSITLNGTIVHSVVNNETMEVSNVKVYAGNPWGDPQLGFIRNFIILTGPSGISHQWSAWSSCNVSCGYGWRTRSRDYCLTDYWEKSSTSSELIKCFRNDTCEVNWSQWSDWSQCIVSSGNGFIKRTRICNSTNSFEWCSGNSSEFSACLNNTWDHWSDWSPCNVSCGNGFKNRSWVCNNTQSLELCANKTSEILDCYSNKACDDHWSNWSSCSALCGNGFKSRSWICNNTQSLEFCANKTFEISDCYNNETCDGEWSTWSECSATCGLGYKSSCLRNSLFEGQNESIRIEKCINKKCPVDGKWSEWIDSQPCSESCGIHLIQKKRYCNNPSASDGGRECWGQSENFQLCSNSTVCPVDGGWTLWSSWTLCNKPCQGGSQLRSRDCTNPVPKYGGLPCNGSDKEFIVCHSSQCKKVSVNINLFFTDEDYIKQYSNPTKEASMELKSRIKAAIKNLYMKYNKIVYYDLELNSMKDGTGIVNP